MIGSTRATHAIVKNCDAFTVRVCDIKFVQAYFLSRVCSWKILH